MWPIFHHYSCLTTSHSFSGDIEGTHSSIFWGLLCTDVDAPARQVNGSLLTYQTEVGWPASCVAAFGYVTSTSPPLWLFQPADICHGGDSGPCLLVVLFGTQGASFWALWPPGKQLYGTCSLTPVDTAESPRSSYKNTSLSLSLSHSF